MPQESTAEFSFRLQQAIEAHPHSPPTQHGRQSWLLRKLETEANLVVSPNTIHKWVNGISMPRADNTRLLAKVLGVDEVWLALGRKPEAARSTLGKDTPTARGAALILAGLIEARGGRVTFAAAGKTAQLHVNLGKGNIDVIAVLPQSVEDGVTFIVPEPASDARVFGVILDPRGTRGAGSVTLDVVELTDIPRQNLGGFSVVQLEAGKNGQLRLGSAGEWVKPLGSLRDLEAA